MNVLLMIPLTTLYDEYIDRPKLSEKKPFEYIVRIYSVSAPSLFNEPQLQNVCYIARYFVRK